MKRLAYLANYFPSLTETFIYREVMELKRRDVAVRLYSLRRPDEKEVSEEALGLRGETSYLLPVRNGELLACHAWFFCRSPLAYTGTLFKMLTGTHNSFRDRVRSLTHFGEGAVLARRMMREGITHIHSHYASQSTSVARVVHLLTGIPYSFTGHAHDIWHDRLLLPEKLKEASFVATCSTFAKNFLAREGRGCDAKIHVVYHGLDVRKFSPPAGGTSRVPNRILSVGSLGPTKGYPDLIRACALLREKLPDFECVIVGEGPMRDELERLISDLGLSGRVRLVGSVPQEGLIDYYHEAWIFVLPCVVAGDGRRDGLPNVLMEAMATGLPVITTRSTAQEELVEHGRQGLLTTPHDPEELASAIFALCGDVKLRESLSANARTRMEREFDNRTTIEPLLELFDRYVFVEGVRSGHRDFSNPDTATGGTLFLKWFPYDKRNETVAAALGAECHFICSLKKRTPWNAPLRYLLQAFKTLLLLWRKRPATVLVTNPPVFAAATVALHCAVFGGRYIMDSHSGAMADRWRIFQGLHRLVASKAALVVITNETFQSIYRGWGAHTRIISDIVMDIPRTKQAALGEGFHIMVICSFDPDEPVEEILSAAAKLPDVSFMVTGNFRRLPVDQVRNSTPNVTFTGFLPDEEYFALLHACQAVMVLVNTEDTMQQGAYEAVSVKKPMVLSNWRLLRESYPRGAVFVENEPESIRAGVIRLVEHYDRYRLEAEAIHKERLAIWEENCRFLAGFCGNVVAGNEDHTATSLDT